MVRMRWVVIWWKDLILGHAVVASCFQEKERRKRAQLSFFHWFQRLMYINKLWGSIIGGERSSQRHWDASGRVQFESWSKDVTGKHRFQFILRFLSGLTFFIWVCPQIRHPQSQWTLIIFPINMAIWWVSPIFRQTHLVNFTVPVTTENVWQISALAALVCLKLG